MLIVSLILACIVILIYMRPSYAWIIASIIVRIMQLGYMSDDMKGFLLKWFNYMKDNGGLYALKNLVGDYNILYETILALLTYIPVDAVLLIKVVSIFFDYLLAFSVEYLVFMLTREKKKGILAACVCIMHPVIYFNSAAWGQCDSIYVFFIVASMICLLKNKYGYSFACLGLAFSFKLQTIFVLPFFIFYYIYKKEFSCLYFLYVPTVMFLSSAVGILYGRGVFEFVKIYFRQTKEYPYFYMGYPGFWVYFTKDNLTYEMRYIWLAVAFAVIMCALVGIFSFWCNRRNLNNISLVKCAFITTYSFIYFLPCMHERYGYLIVVLALILSVVDESTVGMFTILSIIEISTHSIFLFRLINPYGIIGIVNTICFLLYFRYFLHQSDLNIASMKKWVNSVIKCQERFCKNSRV